MRQKHPHVVRERPQRWIDPLAPAAVGHPPRALLDVYRYFLRPVRGLPSVLQQWPMTFSIGFVSATHSMGRSIGCA